MAAMTDTDAFWYHLWTFEKYRCLGPTPRDSDLIGLNSRIFKNSASDSNVQLRLGKTATVYPYQTYLVFTYCKQSFDFVMLYFNTLLYFNSIKPVLLHILPCTA